MRAKSVRRNRHKPTVGEQITRIAEMIRKLALKNLETKELDVTAMYALQDAVNDAAYVSPIPSTSNAPKGV